MMRLHSCVAILVAVAIAASSGAGQGGKDMSGEWLIDLDPDFGGRPDTINCTFKQEGPTLRL